MTTQQDVVDAALAWFEWHVAHPCDGGPFDVRDERLYRVVSEYRLPPPPTRLQRFAHVLSTGGMSLLEGRRGQR